MDPACVPLNAVQARPLRARCVVLTLIARQRYRSRCKQPIITALLGSLASWAIQNKATGPEVPPISLLPSNVNSVDFPLPSIRKDYREGMGGFVDNGIPRLQPGQGRSGCSKHACIRSLFYGPDRIKHVVELHSYLTAGAQLGLNGWHVHVKPILMKQT